jgi:UDP-2-acetamido-2,6-beta-L-arabino-hexul-4-ose reductase
MKVGVTGSNGFIGKNLLEHLSRMENIEVITLTRTDSDAKLEELFNRADFIFHLAGINRQKTHKSFMKETKTSPKK